MYTVALEASQNAFKILQTIHFMENKIEELPAGSTLEFRHYTNAIAALYKDLEKKLETTLEEVKEDAYQHWEVNQGVLYNYDSDFETKGEIKWKNK